MLDCPFIKSTAIFSIGLAAGAIIKSFIYDDPEVSKSLRTGLSHIVDNIKNNPVCTTMIATGSASGLLIVRHINIISHNHGISFGEALSIYINYRIKCKHIFTAAFVSGSIFMMYNVNEIRKNTTRVNQFGR